MNSRERGLKHFIKEVHKRCNNKVVEETTDMYVSKQVVVSSCMHDTRVLSPTPGWFKQ